MATEQNKEIQKAKPAEDIKTIHPIRTLSSFDDIDRLFERWFDSFSPRSWLRPFHTDWHSTWAELPAQIESRIPKVDIIDRDDEIVVRAEIPGIDKDDLDISISDNTVTIKGETKHEQKEEKGNYYRCEISHGSFSRTVSLPQYVNSEAASAKFKDGVLELTAPKVEKAKRRTIKVD